MSALFHRDGGCHQPPILSVPIKKIWIDGERVIRCSKGCREGWGGGGRGAKGTEIRLESVGAEADATKGAKRREECAEEAVN